MSAVRRIRDAALAMLAGRHDRTADPLVVGAVGIVLVAAVMAVALAAPRVTYLLRTDEYTAELANAAGLQPDDPVYVAGVPAGRVEDLRLGTDRVVVTFRVDGGQPLGDRTAAEVKLKTILGKLYLSVTPAGPGNSPRAGSRWHAPPFRTASTRSRRTPGRWPAISTCPDSKR